MNSVLPGVVTTSRVEDTQVNCKVNDTGQTEVCFKEITVKTLPESTVGTAQTEQPSSPDSHSKGQ